MRFVTCLGLLVLVVGEAFCGSESIAERALGRFLRYARIATHSADGVDRIPSTTAQLDFARLLVGELRTLGLSDVTLDAKGYVIATLASNLPADKARQVPTIGLVCHLDTSSDAGTGAVKPIVHKSYRGGDIILPGDRSKVIRVAEDPDLKDEIGADVVTADGTSVLGADDKAGIAALLTAVEELLRHPEIPRGRVRLAFTPDEEIDRSMEAFDVKAFGAKYAYTVDGGEVGELNDRTFNASSGTVTFTGRSQHPGYAKGKMVNSLYAASRFLAEIPPGMRPENVDGEQGFVHVNDMAGSEEKTTVKLILRDFERKGLTDRARFVEDTARRVAGLYPGTKVTVKIEERYRNMGDILKTMPFVVDFADEAMRGAGVKVVRKPVRGGTDGSQLTFAGLPCPNIFTGEHGAHSVLEWVSSRDLALSTRTIVNLVEIWATKGAGR